MSLAGLFSLVRLCVFLLLMLVLHRSDCCLLGLWPFGSGLLDRLSWDVCLIYLSLLVSRSLLRFSFHCLLSLQLASKGFSCHLLDGRSSVCFVLSCITNIIGLGM